MLCHAKSPEDAFGTHVIHISSEDTKATQGLLTILASLGYLVSSHLGSGTSQKSISRPISCMEQCRGDIMTTFMRRFHSSTTLLPYTCSCWIYLEEPDTLPQLLCHGLVLDVIQVELSVGYEGVVLLRRLGIVVARLCWRDRD